MAENAKYDLPAFCLRAGQCFDAAPPILPRVIAA
jgi:hypothetical protein